MRKSIRGVNLDNKKVIIRCDFNVPIKNNVIEDDTRIKASLETINYVLSKNTKVILMSHLGKIKEEKDKEKNSLLVVSKRLSELLGREVLFSSKTSGDELTNMVNSMNFGDVLLIENTRYEDLEGKKESSCDLELAKYWASLADVFINDAYGTIHRKHASNYGIATFLPNAMGFLLEKEIEQIDKFMDSNEGLIVIMGGKKIQDKIPLIRNILPKCDKLLIGGGMAATFLKVKGYNMGSSVIDEEALDFVKEMLDKHFKKIVLPVDVIVNDEIKEEESSYKLIGNLDNSDMMLDIGTNTVSLFTDYIGSHNKVLMNGPVGVFEMDSYSVGTKNIFEYLAENKIKTLICGGDTISALSKLKEENNFLISTGGGATLSYLSEEDMPSLNVLNMEDDG